MASISIDNEIMKYLPMLGSKEKQSVLAQIKSLLKRKDASEEQANEEYLTRYNTELNEADNRVSEGHFISHEDLEKESESWKDEV